MSSTIAFDIIAKDRASDKFDKVGNSAERSSGKLKKFAKVGAVAVAAGAVMAGKALWDMGKAAMEDEKSQALLAKGLKNTTGATGKQIGAVEDWITAQGKALGVTDDDLRPALQRLAEATGDVRKAQKLAALSMDVSAGSGKSLKQVSEAMAKAQNGNVGALGRLGVATKDAEGKTKSFKQITEDLAKLHGGQAAKAAGTTEGQFKRLKLQFDEAKESLGAKLLPIATKFADFALNKLVPAIGKIGDWISKNVIPPLREFAQKYLSDGKSKMDALKGALSDAKPFFELLGRVITKVLVPALGKILDVVGPVINIALKGLGKALEAVGKAGTWLWNNALQPAFKFIVKGIGWVMDGFAKMLEGLGKVPGFEWADKAAKKMKAAADSAYEMADGIKKIPSKKYVNIFVSTITRGQALDQIAAGAGGAGKAGSNGRMSLRDMRTTGEKLMDALTKGFKSGGKGLQKVLGDNIQRLKDSLATIRSEMSSMSESIASALNPTDFGGGMAELMASLTGNNGALSGLAAVFDKLKGSVSKGFLSSLMESGNTGLATSLANDPAAAAQASALFDQNAAIAKGLGDQTAQTVLGDKITKALKDEIGKLLAELKESPGKQAKHLKRELQGIKIELTGRESAGRTAYLRGAN